MGRRTSGNGSGGSRSSTPARPSALAAAVESCPGLRSTSITPTIAEAISELPIRAAIEGSPHAAAEGSPNCRQSNGIPGSGRCRSDQRCRGQNLDSFQMETASDRAPAAEAILGPRPGADDDRKGQAAALYMTGEWSERKLAAEFGVSRITMRHWLDELSVRRRTKAEAAWQRSDWTKRRRSLLAEAGGCGSPTCGDPDCQVKSGACHRADCSENAVIAAQTSRRRRSVRGYPTKYCSGTCSAIDNRPHERFKLEFERLRDNGLYDVETVAGELDRAPQTVLRHVHLLELGQWGAGFGQCLLSRDEIELLRDRIIENPRRPTWTDPRLRATWQHHRHGDVGRYGALGGRPPSVVTEAQRQEIEQLASQGWGRRAISNRLLISERAIRNVLSA
jgi:hypothetical protein